MRTNTVVKIGDEGASFIELYTWIHFPQYRNNLVPILSWGYVDTAYSSDSVYLEEERISPLHAYDYDEQIDSLQKNISAIRSHNYPVEETDRQVTAALSFYGIRQESDISRIEELLSFMQNTLKVHDYGIQQIGYTVDGRLVIFDWGVTKLNELLDEVTYQQYIDARYFDYESYAEKIQQERQSTHPEFYQPTTPDEAFAKSLVIPVVKVLDETAQIFDKKADDICRGGTSGQLRSSSLGALLPIGIFEGDIRGKQDKNSNQYGKDINKIHRVNLSKVHSSNFLTSTRLPYQSSNVAVNPAMSTAILNSLVNNGVMTALPNMTWATSRAISARDASWAGESLNGLATKTSFSTQENNNIIKNSLSNDRIATKKSPLGDYLVRLADLRIDQTDNLAQRVPFLDQGDKSKPSFAKAAAGRPAEPTPKSSISRDTLSFVSRVYADNGRTFAQGYGGQGKVLGVATSNSFGCKVANVTYRPVANAFKSAAKFTSETLWKRPNRVIRVWIGDGISYVKTSLKDVGSQIVAATRNFMIEAIVVAAKPLIRISYRENLNTLGGQREEDIKYEAALNRIRRVVKTVLELIDTTNLIYRDFPDFIRNATPIHNSFGWFGSRLLTPLLFPRNFSRIALPLYETDWQRFRTGGWRIINWSNPSLWEWNWEWAKDYFSDQVAQGIDDLLKNNNGFVRFLTAPIRLAWWFLEPALPTNDGITVGDIVTVRQGNVAGVLGIVTNIERDNNQLILYDVTLADGKRTVRRLQRKQLGQASDYKRGTSYLLAQKMSLAANYDQVFDLYAMMEGIVFEEVHTHPVASQEEIYRAVLARPEFDAMIHNKEFQRLSVSAQDFVSRAVLAEVSYQRVRQAAVLSKDIEGPILAAIRAADIQTIALQVKGKFTELKDSGCFSYNPFVSKVYAAGEDEKKEGKTCASIFRAPWKVVKGWVRGGMRNGGKRIGGHATETTNTTLRQAVRDLSVAQTPEQLFPAMERLIPILNSIDREYPYPRYTKQLTDDDYRQLFGDDRVQTVSVLNDLAKTLFIVATNTPDEEVKRVASEHLWILQKIRNAFEISTKRYTGKNFDELDNPWTPPDMRMLYYLTGIWLTDDTKDVFTHMLLADHEAFRIKYGLPSEALIDSNPEAYTQALLAIAKANNITLLSKDDLDVQLFFQRHSGYVGGTYFPEYRGIALNPRSAVDWRDSQNGIRMFEHELIHALQNDKFRELTHEQREYEAYVGGYFMKGKLQTDKNEGIGLLLEGFNTSLRQWWYLEKNMSPPWSSIDIPFDIGYQKPNQIVEDVRAEFFPTNHFELFLDRFPKLDLVSSETSDLVVAAQVRSLVTAGEIVQIESEVSIQQLQLIVSKALAQTSELTDEQRKVWEQHIGSKLPALVLTGLKYDVQISKVDNRQDIQVNGKIYAPVSNLGTNRAVYLLDDGTILKIPRIELFEIVIIGETHGTIVDSDSRIAPVVGIGFTDDGTLYELQKNVIPYKPFLLAVTSEVLENIRSLWDGAQRYGGQFGRFLAQRISFLFLRPCFRS